MELTGVMPPIATPFTDGEVALDRLKDNFEKWNRTELSGYLVLGSNGETVSLHENEKLSVVETAREAIPSSKLMLVGTGMESTRETIRFSNQAAKIGADYALVITPSFFKASMTPQALYDHFSSIADSSHIKILLYNVPKFTGINMEPDLVARLSSHPNIAGIKDSSGNIGQLSEIIHLCQQDFAVFTGSAPVLFPALCVGAAGGIVAAANAVPEEFCKIRSLFLQGNLEQARELQNCLTPLAKAVTARYGIGGLKIAMDLAGYFGGEPRAPLQKPGKDVEEELQQLLAKATHSDHR